MLSGVSLARATARFGAAFATIFVLLGAFISKLILYGRDRAANAAFYSAGLAAVTTNP